MENPLAPRSVPALHFHFHFQRSQLIIHDVKKSKFKKVKKKKWEKKISARIRIRSVESSLPQIPLRQERFLRLSLHSLPSVFSP
mmetsp:Transcript_2274/g.3214  ORF Transcript_2274/g.3214 Transcript_2274/m.3214 type:complete len:84 (-) Transcript_2274:107-358(-)